jgi:hypothetical protein
MRGLHGERHAYAECCQGNHRRCAHSDKDHLPENRRDFEKLSAKRRNQNPIKQAGIKLEIVFQNTAVIVLAAAQNDKTSETTKAESSATER